MSLWDGIVILSGVAAIAWVNWYFFVARPPAVTARIQEGGAHRGGLKLWLRR